MTPGRNEPCPCGSGKRYKQCCGLLASSVAAPPEPPAPVPDTPGALVAALKQGRFQQVERAAEELLRAAPDSGVLWKILGVALAGQGKDAVPALRRAAALLPQDAEAQRNLAAVMLELQRWDEALASLRRALEIEPRSVEALMAAAQALSALGRAAETISLYERALEIEPRLLEARNNLGNVLQELGELARAVNCYHEALAIRPDDAELHCNLSNALRQLGQLEQSLESSQRAVALAPRLATAHNNLGLALAALGRLEEGVLSFQKAVQLNPRFLEAVTNLGNGLRDLGRHREALTAFRNAVELDPQRADGHLSLGNAHYECRELTEAEASLRRALELKPVHAPTHLGLAAVLRLAGRAAEAESSCRAALAAEPESVAALALLGHVLGDRGAFEEARQLSERALALDPGFPPALAGIASQRRMTSADSAWLQRVQALLGGRQPLEYEMGLRFALGKYFDDLGDYDRAFEEYRQANELGRRAAPPYDPAHAVQYVDETIARYGGAELRAAHAGASDSELPVFVVGMPRSGTTLAEQILASHPQVFGAGEVRFWDSAAAALPAAGLGAAVAPQPLAGIARDYLARIAPQAGAALRVIDKMPANFLYLGLIHAVFPRARIVHMQRNPLDTCLSIYFQNLTATSPFSSDLDDLAHFYREYLRITRHWRAVLPATTLLEVPYEGLVEAQEQWTRRMLEFVGLPWDPRCLDFHRTERVVITASRWQVRQKIYRGSVERWRHYEKHIGPLRHLADLAPSSGARRAGA